MFFETTKWNLDLTQAPTNTRLLVIDTKGHTRWATFDPTWGGARGAWFSDKNQILNVFQWRNDGEDYIQEMRIVENSKGIFLRAQD
jgi:hypothetical protein